MANSLDLDLIQLKWQHIRSMEALQSAERENVHLKEIIETLKKYQEEAGLKTDKEREALSNLKKMLRLYQEQNFRLKEDFKRLKLTINQEHKVSAHQQELLKLSFQSIFSNLQRSEEELMKSKQSQTALMNQLADSVKSQNSQAAQKSSQSNELQEAKARINELTSQISSLKSEKEKLKTEQQQFKDNLDDFSSQIEKLSSKNETLSADFTKYKKITIEKDAEKTLQINNLQQVQVETQENYEKILNQLNHENEFLRGTIVDLEDQVRKLSLSLVGNKSHFAKYIEVKTENVSLQNKLAVAETILSSGSVVPTNTKLPNRQKGVGVGRLPSQINQSLGTTRAKEDNPLYSSTAETVVLPPSSRTGNTEQSSQPALPPQQQQKAPVAPYTSSFTNHHSIFNTGLSIVSNSNNNSSSDRRSGESHPTQSADQQSSSRSNAEVDTGSGRQQQQQPRVGHHSIQIDQDNRSSGGGGGGGGGRKSLRVLRSSTDRTLDGGPPLPRASFADRLAI